MKYFEKIAYVGNVLWNTTPQTFEDTKAITLKRGLRKHKNIKMPKVHDQYVLAKAIESLEKDVGKVKYKYNATPAAGKDGIVYGPNKKSIVTGHELGHLLDNKKHGIESSFFGDPRGHALSKPSTHLRSEASASKHILGKLPSGIKRTKGPLLAHAYDTYATHATVYPKNLLHAQLYGAAKKEKPKIKLMKKLTKKFKYGTGPVHARYPTGMKYKFIDRYKAIKESRTLSNTNAYLKEGNKVTAVNKQHLIKKLKKLNKKDTKLVQSETLKYIKDTKKLFGNDVTRGVIDEIRDIKKAVGTKTSLLQKLKKLRFR